MDPGFPVRGRRPLTRVLFRGNVQKQENWVPLGGPPAPLLDPPLITYCIMDMYLEMQQLDATHRLSSHDMIQFMARLSDLMFSVRGPWGDQKEVWIPARLFN